MSGYLPYRGIESVEDLLLVSRKVESTPTAIELPADAHYPEITIWVRTACPEDDLFADSDRTLLQGVPTEGMGWRLVLTAHGYLRFEAGEGDDAVSCTSAVPVHSAVDSSEGLKLGFSLANNPWSLRGTEYATEGASYFRLRLLVGSADRDGFIELGVQTGTLAPDLCPVPETVMVGADADGTRSFAPRINAVAAYNTARHEVFATIGCKSAARVCPAIPGGGGFEARWVDDETVHVFTRPEFCQTASYWAYLRIKDKSRKLRRLIVSMIWRGGANMSPTFFQSADGETWRRIVPRSLRIGEPGGGLYRAEFRIPKKLCKGGYLASGPVFAGKQLSALLDWAEEQEHTTVAQIGESVEGRPLHAIRVGRKPDGPETKGIAVVCGQHSPLEVMGAFVIEPIIRLLLARPALLEACTFYFVPVVNVDGAWYGSNGLNANGRNTNRHWLVEVQPENQAVIDYFNHLRDIGQSIDFAMDIHAGGIFKNHVLMHMVDGEGATLTQTEQAAQETWRDLLEQHAGLRRADGWGLAQLKLRATDYFHLAHMCQAFCLEISSCSYFDPADRKTKVFGPEAFGVLAEGFVETWEQQFVGRATE